MQPKLHFYACFILYFCGITSGFAQQYSYVHYTPKDGLVNSRVRKAFQDSKGRLYFLTFGGLSVFDGARFRNYTTENGLADDLVNDILEIRPDSLLIATNTGKLNLLVKGRIRDARLEGAHCPVVNFFYQHTKGIIYLSADEGLYALQNNTIRELNITPLKEQENVNPALGNISGWGQFLLFATTDLPGKPGVYLYDTRSNRIVDSVAGRQFEVQGRDEGNRVLD